MILEATIDIAADARRVYRFFAEMAQRYTAWHPDHIAFRWVNDAELAVGSRFRIEERIDGRVLKRTMRFTRLEPDRHVEFVPDNALIRFFLPRILFAIEPAGDGCRVTQQVHVRIGPIGRRLNRRGFAVVLRHMREEGENLKALLDAEARAGE
jgi:uncharacterized protein YndB with AHSA1/START domain